MKKIFKYMSVSSEFFKEIFELADRKYGINDIIDNDKDAIYARIVYIQNHEAPMR